jgi:hypothetical protein
MPKKGSLWTNEERRELVTLWWEEGVDKAAKKLGRSEAACWIELARIALYGIELAEFRNRLRNLEGKLTKIDRMRGPDVDRILKEYKRKSTPIRP